MNADREPNRLPLRAGAMMLLAVAIVFIGLGWHSAVSNDDDPQADLATAGGTATTTSAPASMTSASPSVSADVPQLCVLNAGSISGLASEVTDDLKAKGFQTAEPANLATSSITENTIFYDSGQQKAAEEVAKALGGDASIDERPSSFTECSDGLPVIVVTR